MKNESGNLILLSWVDVASLARRMSIDISSRGRPNLVVGISRGGVVIATILAEMLRRNLIVVNVTRRDSDVEIRDDPEITSNVSPTLINNKNILLVDEIVVTGKTMDIARNALLQLGAKNVVTCAIANRSLNSYQCDYQCIVSSSNNIVFPWDYLVLDENDNVIVHPEYQSMNNNLRVSLYGF